MEQKRITRSRKERMIAGVCGGLAEYLDVDPTVMRLLFVLASFVNGLGVVAYLVLWFVAPEAPLAETAADNASVSTSEAPVKVGEAEAKESS